MAEDEDWTAEDEAAWQRILWRRKQQPIGPCCDWPQALTPGQQVLERWPGGQVRRRELWAA